MKMSVELVWMPPISIQCTLMAKKPIKRAALRPGVDRRVHHRVVEVLALHRGVVAEHDVAVMQPLLAVDLQSVAHRHADRVGDERRHAASALRDQLALGADQPDGEIVVLVDIGRERRALDVGVDLVGDRDEAVADHFQRDRIDSERNVAREFLHHRSPATVTRISPSLPTSKPSPGQISVVDPYSSIKAGPCPLKPGASAVRS